MNKTVNYLVKIYLSSRSVDECVNRTMKHLFINCKKELSVKFMSSVTLRFLDELQSFLYFVKFDLKESSYYNEYNMNLFDLTETQLKWIEQMVDVIQARLTFYEETNFINTPYQRLFVEYAACNCPSHSKRGNLSWKFVEDNIRYKKELEKEYADFFKILKEIDTTVQVSKGLLLEVFSKVFFLKRAEGEETFQLNPKDDDILKIMREYCDKTNQKYYADEYNKISNIRTVMHKVAIKIFSKDYKITTDDYFIGKFHTRLIFKLKLKQREVKFSKSFNNYFIIFNNFSFLLHKTLKQFHIRNKKYTKVYDSTEFSSTDTS